MHDMNGATAFAGIRPILHTPFRADATQSVDVEALEALVAWTVQVGLDGVVALGLSSEAWALTEDERDVICETVGGLLPGGFIAGVDGATRVACSRAQRAVERGATALMVVPPRQAGSAREVRAHLRAVATESAVPILIQDAPQVSGVPLTVDDLLALGEDPLLSSVKVEGLAAGPKISALVEGGMHVVAGWGGLQYLESFDRGAIGCIPGCELALPLQRVHKALLRGERDLARRIYQAALPLLAYETQSLDLLISAAKRFLVREALFSSEIRRLPMTPLDGHQRAELDRLLEELAVALSSSDAGAEG